uniref:THAP domaincontaining protein 9like [Ciona intestinalis] n=1 Tax=Lepeophtheirus salmonis TaxID=72036 RepID=A0A0K2VDX8_LEPSM
MKIKVNFATQLISSSVVHEIKFYNKDLQLPEFRNSERTVEFLRRFDTLFDFTNSRNLLAKGFKSPRSIGIKDYWKPIFQDMFLYISELKDAFGKPLVKTRKITDFVGFMASITNGINAIE